MKQTILTTLLLAAFLLSASAQNTPDRGFRHPGGLHTQADFDRVRAQLDAGNERVVAAYDVLRKAAYAQSGVQTYPVETIVRGGGSGENYINAARGATMAYQNALRWKIEDNKACAQTAVRILMAWARTTKQITGNSDQCLAVGLYGYQFAQAAELMRDYEGWAREDFEEFRQWMLGLWYPKAIGFLRHRNGTWENQGKWWQAPGHYWSNWGLCNALCVVSIGVLCDDVFIYNQGMSYFKYDQVGTYRNPRTEVPIKNDGLTEFLGNLVVTTADSELETGAYGQLGQMNESGRDTGHSAMALGLAIDLAKVGWNQGDDLFSYMDHRLAAGIEYVAAQTQSVEGLPWVNYHYGSSGYYYSDSRAWLMTGPALGAQMRPYWGTVMGVYEGVKGVRMPFAEASYKDMGIDAGGQGSTSGGYDHLGYSVLMNTRDVQLCPEDQRPTELRPLIEYDGSLTGNLIPSLAVERQQGNIDGKKIYHSELGGLVNTYSANNRTCVPAGTSITLSALLPDGEENTGQWQWSTGAATPSITITADHSQLYRVSYVNSRGVKSEQLFAIAVEGDNTPSAVTASIKIGNETLNDTVATVFYGQRLTLSISGSDGYGTCRWQNGSTAATLTTGQLTSDTIITATYLNQSYTPTLVRFHIHMKYTRPDITLNGTTLQDSLMVIAQQGDRVEIGPYVPSTLEGMTYEWTKVDGDSERFEGSGRTLLFDGITASGIYTVSCLLNGQPTASYRYRVYVSDSEARVAPGSYAIRHTVTQTYMTAQGPQKRVAFEASEDGMPSARQVWVVDDPEQNGRYSIQTPDGNYISTSLLQTSNASAPFAFDCAAASSYVAMKLRLAGYYILLGDDLTIDTRSSKTLTDYPFELIPVDISGIEACPELVGQNSALSAQDSASYDLQGRKVLTPSLPALQGGARGRLLPKGIYIVNGKKIVIQ